MDNEAKLISDALNLHGIFFKKSARNMLQKIKGVSILAEEYPVGSNKDGARIDLLIRFDTGKSTYVIPIECKRGYAGRKRWLFFEDPDKATKLIYAFSGKELVVGDAAAFKQVEICMEGLEIDVGKLRKNPKDTNKLKNSASTENIWNTCKQICMGLFGFLMQELDQREKSLPSQETFRIFPLLLTTAPLFVVTPNIEKIDYLTGNYNEELPMRKVPWLIVRYPTVPQIGYGSKHLQIVDNNYTNVATRGLRSKEGIIVLNIQNISNFFKNLKEIN